jgi:hypothetical protein
MATLTAVARTMYPHDALPDDVYARVGERLAEAARQDPDAARMIEDGVAALDGARPFTERSADERLEGPSFDKGGYLHRGFNDLDWLPDPEAAS